MIRDAELEELFSEYTAPLFKAAGISPNSIHLHIVNTSDMNAFVTQGNHMFVYTGLILKTETPEQLIGVIAHETGHIVGGTYYPTDPTK